jgi:hypothetical protein
MKLNGEIANLGDMFYTPGTSQFFCLFIKQITGFWSLIFTPQITISEVSIPLL